MIELQVKDYCQNCPDFEPTVDKKLSYADDEVIYSLMTVCCKNASRCERMLQDAKECINILKRSIKSMKETKKLVLIVATVILVVDCLFANGMKRMLPQLQSVHGGRKKWTKEDLK